VTALVQAINGSAGNEQLMDERDAAPGFSWRFGTRRRPLGSVQVSVDDPSFGRVVTARFVRYPKSARWTLSIPVAGLGQGRHVLYVRDRVRGFSSRVAVVPFTVA
jgi:hypothetical protein